MQDFTKEEIESLVASWKNHNKNQYWAKKHTAISKYLQALKHTLNDFDEFENEFLQNLYIKLSDGNLRSTKILELGERFLHAEYFFMDQFFDPNISAFYYDFAFKDRIVSKKDYFPKTAATSVAGVLSGEDKDIVSLYVYIENIVKNFNAATAERVQRNAFKQKIINFYDELYRLFVAVDSTLAVDFFDIVLHNQPYSLIEFLKATIKTDNFYLIDSYLSDDGVLNLGIAADGNLEQISCDKLYLLASVFTQTNDSYPTLLYSDECAQLLGSIYSQSVENFAGFYDIGAKFVAEFTPYPSELSGTSRAVYASLFFEYIKNYNSVEVSKNTIFFGAIASGKTCKLRSLIAEKKLPLSHFRYLSFHNEFTYSDFIDGFVGGRFINGEFKQLCKNALADPKNDYYLAIDSIDDGDFDTIFGESVALLDRRYDENDPFSLIRTKNSHIIDTFDDEAKVHASVVVKDGLSYFAIPKNVFILCATNGNSAKISASSAKLFRWSRCDCNYGALEDSLNDHGITNAKAATAVCRALNDFVCKDSRLGNEIGHGVFMGLARYQSNAQITQESLNGFFAEVLEPIFICAYAKSDISVAKQISSAKDIFKF